MFKGQLPHYVFIAGSLALFVNLPSIYLAEEWGYQQKQSIAIWSWISIIVAILHQLYVWLIWRLELVHQFISKHMGKMGIYAFVADFFLLFLCRFAAVIYLAYIDSKSYPLSPDLVKTVSILIILPALYTFYSIVRYFGLIRAVGIDHFDMEYRLRPLVKDGIFKYVPHPMYTFAIQIIWLPGLWWESRAALVAALFTSIYIWIHFFCTERPDMQEMYK